MSDIRTDDYSVSYDQSSHTVICKGAFRLSGVAEYAPISQLLNDVLNEQPPVIVLNLRELQFLNSSGINVLSKFVISVRQKGSTQLVVQGSKSIPWQGKSLQNLQRLMPSLKLELEG
jgi:hypothetical protein